MGKEVGGIFKREGTHVYLWPIHVEVWQEPSQYCKEIILSLKKKKTAPGTYTRIVRISRHHTHSKGCWEFPVVQWLGLCASTAGRWVPSLVAELRLKNF